MSNKRNLAPRRILHLRTVVGRGGGPEKTLLNSHRFLRDCYELRLAYFHPLGDERYDMPEKATALGASLCSIPEFGPCDPRALRQFARLIREYRPHLLHAHDYKTNALGLVYGRAFGIPLVTTLHGYGNLSPRLKAYYYIDRFALRRMKRVFAVSRDLVEYAYEIGVRSERVTLIENGIDLEQFRRRLSIVEAKARLGIDSQTCVLGAIGRLMEEKGFDVLIQAIAQLSSRGWSGRLLIAGEGPDRQKLESLIVRLRCDDVVQLLGYRADVAEVLQACDAFVLSSHREASPNVVLEAMALETPIIATRVAGVPNMLTDGKSGLLVEPNDVAGLTAAIGRLFANPALPGQLASNARRICEERYCFRRRMEREQDAYDEILGVSDATK